jgi:hypothetical protein
MAAIVHAALSSVVTHFGRHGAEPSDLVAAFGLLGFAVLFQLSVPDRQTGFYKENTVIHTDKFTRNCISGLC